MMRENPYQSPAAATGIENERDELTFTTRGRAIAAGAWRGAKFGGRLMGMIMGTLMGLLWLFAIAAIIYRWLYVGDDIGRIMDKLRPLEFFGTTLLAIISSTVLAAAIGAIIMGTTAGISYRREGRDRGPNQPPSRG
jgi:hypothetical protein